MRPRSVVAPLLVVALGGLVLAHNVIPDFAALDFLSRYWPALLILWGALHVLEILLWSATSKPLPARGIAGGEWALIVVICMMGAGFTLAREIQVQVPGFFDLRGIEEFGDRYEFPVSREQASTHAPRVVLEDFRGEANITGVETGPDEVKITGQKIIRSFDQEDANRANANAPLEITGDAGNVLVRLRQPSGPRRASATLEIAVPKGASVEVQGRNARSLRVDSIQGSVSIRGRGSDLELANIGGPATVEGSFSGNVQFRNLAKPLHFTGRRTEFSVEKIPGQLRMDAGDLTATDIAGPTRLSSRSRDTRITDFAGPLEVSVDRGDLEISTSRLPLGPVQARSRSGDIRLALPPAAQFTISASTSNGRITNSFGGSLKLDESRRRSHLGGSNGNGPSIELETGRGDIALEQLTRSSATAAPLQKLEQ